MSESESGSKAPRPAVPPQGGIPAPTYLSWRVPGRVIVGKLAAAAVLLLAGVLITRDRPGMLLLIVAAIAVAGFALRDLLAPVRLAADSEGLTVVTGFAGTRRIPWRDVERIRVDERRRFGLRSALLEIDAGASLHLFSGGELGAPVADVADALRCFRTGR